MLNPAAAAALRVVAAATELVLAIADRVSRIRRT